MPWWAAVVIAVIGAAVGFAFDAGSGKELTSVFSGLYVVGCLAAVLAVRQSGIFTAVIQPPLILFCAVPGAYFLFHGAKYTGVKDLLINCGYPLIERFPLMLFTSAAVLLVGLVRWGLDRVVRRPRTAAEDDGAEVATKTAATPGLAAKLTSMLNREHADDEEVVKPARPRTRKTHSVERSTRSTSARSTTGGRPAPARARRPRPPMDDSADSARDRERRRRPIRTGELDSPEPPRRGRLPRDLEQPARPPWEVRRDTQARRPRPASRSGRPDPRQPAEPYDSAPPPPPRRRPGPNGSSRATATHHPVSRVRYRDNESPDEPSARPPRPRKAAGENWDYDR